MFLTTTSAAMRPKRVDAFHRATNGGFDIAFKADGTNAAQTARIDGVRLSGKIEMIEKSIAAEVPSSMNRATLQEGGSAAVFPTSEKSSRRLST